MAPKFSHPQKMNLPTLRLLTTLALALPAALLADTTLYNIQFNGATPTFTGSLQSGVSGTVWNNPTLTLGSTSLVTDASLLTSTGAASSVLFSATQLYTGKTYAYSSQTTGGAVTGFDDYLLKFDYDSGLGYKNAETFTLTGLPDAADVTLYFYGSGTATNSGAKLALGSAVATISFDGSATGRDVTQGSNLGLSWNMVTGLTDQTGSLTFTVTGPDSGVWWQNYLSGFQLEVTTAASAVPEPSTCAALAGIAALGLAARRRSRRQA